MVAPSALAMTVTPPIFSPDAEVTAPDRIASAATAGTVASARSATDADRMNRMGRLLVERCSVGIGAAAAAPRRGRARGIRRHGLQIADDRVDLLRLEVVFKARH